MGRIRSIPSQPHSVKFPSYTIPPDILRLARSIFASNRILSYRASFALPLIADFVLRLIQTQETRQLHELSFPLPPSWIQSATWRSFSWIGILDRISRRTLRRGDRTCERLSFPDKFCFYLSTNNRTAPEVTPKCRFLWGDFYLWRLLCHAWIVKLSKYATIDPIHKGVSLFLLYTNMNKMNGLHHVKEHPKITNFLQFESHSSKRFKVRAIWVSFKRPRPN